MYVSTTKVLRNFSEKMARSAKTAVQYEPMILPEDTYTHGAVKDVTNKPSSVSSSKMEQARHEQHLPAQNTAYSKVMNALRTAGKGVDSGVNTASTWLHDNGLPAGIGAGVGAGALYGIARLMQSEEDRKKRRPVVAPVLGAVGGAALAPLLANMLAHRNAVAGIGKTDQSPAAASVDLNPAASGMKQIGPAEPTALS